jgi:hypothetical protein
MQGFFLQILFAASGILANGITIPVLLSREMSNVFNRTLACLAIFDNIYLVIAILDSVRMHITFTAAHTILFPKVNTIKPELKFRIVKK